MDILILLGLYSLAILLFVPLEKIGRAQTTVKKTTKRWLEKIKD